MYYTYTHTHTHIHMYIYVIVIDNHLFIRIILHMTVIVGNYQKNVSHKSYIEM